MLKKSLISLLVVAMMASFGTMALAGTASTIEAPAFSDISGHDAEFALSALGGLGVFTGDSGLGGPVRPDDTITRAEFCKVVVEAMGKGTIAAGLAGLTPNFTDAASIPSWAWGYVNAAQMMGVVGGYPDGSFKPDNAVSYAEAVTMLVRAVAGHKAQVPEGTWPYNYLWYGLDNGFTGDADVSFPLLPCPRGDMAMMVLATMQVPRLTSEGEEVLDSEMLSGRIFEGALLDYQVGTAANTVTVDLDSDGTADAGETLDLASAVALGLSPNLEGLRNLPVWAITNSLGKVVFVGAVAGEAAVYTGSFREAGWKPAGDTTGYDYLRFWDGTVIPYVSPVTVKINDSLVDGSDAAYDETDLASGDLVTVTRDKDGFAIHCDALRDWVIDSDDTRGWITYINKATSDDVDTVVKVEWLGGTGTYTLNIPYTAKVTINGELADRNDLAKWDVVTFGYYNADNANAIIYVNATRQTVEGKVEAKRTSWPYEITYCTIDGTEYEYNLGSAPVVGQAAKYGLDADGVIYAPISYGTATDVWWVKSYVKSGTPYVDDTVTVDILGTESSMACFESFSDAVRYAAHIEWGTGAGAGKVGLKDDANQNPIIYDDLDVDFENDAGTAVLFTVVSVDPASGVVVVTDGANDLILGDEVDEPTPTVYAAFAYWNGTDWVYVGTEARVASYVGLEGLSYGDQVFVSTDYKLLLLHDERVEWPPQ